jgi:hypothetical protein
VASAKRTPKSRALAGKRKAGARKAPEAPKKRSPNVGDRGFAEADGASQFEKPHAVLDTNVGLSIYSWHDVLDAIGRGLQEDPNATLLHPDVQFRAQRARTAFHLALLFDERSWMTAAPAREMLRLLRTKAPPKTKKHGIKSNFVRFFVYFVKDKLMPGWVAGSNLRAERGLRGNAVDRLCLSWAEQHRVPLVSWEGHGQKGFDRKKLIPREGAARGIDVVTPEQLLDRSNFDEVEAMRRFIARWDEHATKYVESNPSSKETLKMVRSFYRRLMSNDWTP